MALTQVSYLDGSLSIKYYLEKLKNVVSSKLVDDDRKKKSDSLWGWG